MKRKRAEEIGNELYADGGLDAMENMFYSIEFRIKEESGNTEEFGCKSATQLTLQQLTDNNTTLLDCSCLLN
jgi:hypothetical protein